MKILIAEDDAGLLRSLLHIFKKNGYIADGASDGDEALELAASGEYDGIVLDIMMPKKDGISVLKELRSSGICTPALFLSARGETEHRIEGLDAGADDYLPKPFSVPELLARVRAMLRRKENYTPDLLQAADTVLNRSTYEIICGEHSEKLSAKEFQIFEMLMQRHGMIVSTEQLITRIWGWDAEVNMGALWMHISNIRKKLAASGSGLNLKFVRGAGYVLEGDRDK